MQNSDKPESRFQLTMFGLRHSAANMDYRF